MKFQTKRPRESIITIIRQLGYQPISRIKDEFNCLRYLAKSGYPRFHLYIKEDKEKNELIFNLHLDQKRPSYPGIKAHSGEYSGEVVEKEGKRIKEILGKVL